MSAVRSEKVLGPNKMTITAEQVNNYLYKHGVGVALEEFKEVDEIKNIINSISIIYGDQIAVEMALERYLFIIDQYQEQPHLLDPHLESLLGQLLGITKKPDVPKPVLHLAFRLLYLITKTRGFKVVVRLMPHEVADMEPVLAMLDSQDILDCYTWETRYMLLLWLSMVCMIPFDMCRLDSHARAQGQEGKKPTMDRVIDTGKKYLMVSDKSRDAAAYMLARFMTRPDVKKSKLPEFLDWALITLQKADNDSLKGNQSLLAVLSTLAQLFKTGKREDLVEYAPAILQQLTKLQLQHSSKTVIRKLSIKMIQRMGLIFLKARVAAWRYQRGSRSLLANLNQTEPHAEEKRSASLTDEDEEEYDIPDDVEDVIEQLLTGLKDKDTIVRWSAAKGVGRLTGRLPRELADDVVGSIMDLFTITETDGAWHGGCLALAELGRRGLLLPHRLPDVTPVILKALMYDQKRGNFSVGAHVRDAACYVCWAFARAYDPVEMKPHVEEISSALVVVSLFDREFNVRRAAAAAFQENVGRQGQFPHGIEILTTCDYFAVGSMSNCYLKLSLFVANFPEYTLALIKHLVSIKISHWDESVRELASQALHNICPCDVKYMSDTVMPALVNKCTGIDLALRHGAILCAAEIIHALSLEAEKKHKLVTELLSAECCEGLWCISTKLDNAKLYRGFGGELMRRAVCHLIQKCALSHLPCPDDDNLKNWQDLLTSCLNHPQLTVQEAAVAAIPAFCAEYYMDKKTSKAILDKQDLVVGAYLEELSGSRVESVRQSHALALGALPAGLLAGRLHHVMPALMAATHITKEHPKWVEARRDAVIALTRVCCKVVIEPDGDATCCLCREMLADVFETLFTCMKDYTLDSRGDVGAWQREAAMTGLSELTMLLLTTHSSLLTPDIVCRLLCCLIQQSCEKIDRTRAHAGTIFFELLYHSPEIPHIPNRDELKKIFPEDCSSINWAVPGQTFPLFTQLLQVPAYRYSALLGLTVSVGGLTESLVKYSAEALNKYMETYLAQPSALLEFCTLLISVFTDHIKVDRVSVPLLKMLDQLLARGYFCPLFSGQNDFPAQLFSLCKQEVAKSGDPQKLLASIDVFCGLLQCEGDIRTKTLSQLMMFLCHKYPIVRKTASSKFYETLIMYDGIVTDESMEGIMTVLSETRWDDEVSVVKPIRNNLCDLLGVARPTPIIKKGKNA